MRTCLEIKEADLDEWREIKSEATREGMKISEYIFLCHEAFKKKKLDKSLKWVLKHPLKGGKQKIDVIKEARKVWRM